MERNQLSELPAGIFANLSSLGTLWLFDSQLSKLPAGIFDNLTSLGALRLGNNQLSKLPAGIFANLPPSADIELDSGVIIAEANLSILEPSPAKVNEGASAVFRVVLDGIATSEVSVGWRLDCATSGASITAADFTGFGGGCPSGIVEIPSGAVMAVVTIPVAADKLLESRENFNLLLFPDGEGGTDLGNGLVYIIEMTSAAVTVDDGTIGVLSLSADEITVSEGGRPSSFTVMLSDGVTADADIVVEWRVDCSGDVSMDDFVGGECPVGSVRVGAGSSFAMFTVSTQDDTLFENSEEFSVIILGASPDMANRITISSTASMAAVTISDNDSLTVGFVQQDYRVSEDEGSVMLTISVLSGELAAGVSVTVGVNSMDGSATAVRDYIGLTDTVLTVTSEARTQTLSVVINDDVLEEGLEDFTVYLTTLREDVMVSASKAVVRIEDNDMFTVGFVSPDYRVSEGARSVTLAVGKLSGELATDVSVAVVVRTADGTAVSPGDYTVVEKLLTFTSATTTFEVSVDIEDDVFPEGSKKFTVHLTTLSKDVALSVSKAVVTIEDNDTLEVGFVGLDYRVSEDVGSVTLAVSVVSGELAAGVSVAVVVRTADGSATADSDYTGIERVLTFTSETMTFGIPLNISDDTGLEFSEDLTVHLTSGLAGVIIPDARNKAKVIIEASDGAVEIGFAPRDYTVSEYAGSVTLIVSVLSGDILSGDSVTVIVSSMDRSATAGGDYRNLTDTVLTFTSEARTQTLSVDINDDAPVEGSEIFTVHLTTSSDVVLLSVSRATVTIMNNATGIITISPRGLRFRALSVGAFHTCGIIDGGSDDGEVTCWGRSGEGQSTPSLGVRFLAVSAGVSHTCGIIDDGEATCWGDDRFGKSTPPSDVRFRALSAGTFHTCGIIDGGIADGEATCWGRNRFGQSTSPVGCSFPCGERGTVPTRAA